MLRININVTTQVLVIIDDNNNDVIRRYPVSTSKFGAGELKDSYCTPRGRHVIRAKIGSGQPVNTVFVGRRPTGGVYSPELEDEYPDRDWILTRILWLSGCEIGFNRLGKVDTMRRYIYIHGSPDSAAIGKPASIGCIRMKNKDIVDLFGRVFPGIQVEIVE